MCVCCECYALDDGQNILNRQHRGYGIIGFTTEPRIESIQSHWYAFFQALFFLYGVYRQTDREQTIVRFVTIWRHQFSTNILSLMLVSPLMKTNTKRESYASTKYGAVSKGLEIIYHRCTVHIQMRESNNMYECSKYACKHEYTM